MPPGGINTPIEPGLVDLVARGVVETIRSVTPSTWFGPGQALPPVAPKEQGLRQFDYPFAVNQQVQPRVTESNISFSQLRALADNYDLLRLVIETRKDQMVGLPWAFRLRREEGEAKQSHAERSSKDPRTKALNAMFRYPDRERDWKTWLRGFLEEVFVVDALSLAPQYALAGNILGVDVIDGATIVRKIDENGRTPLPPNLAYQQILKGMAAKDLTTRDLIYKPRNWRPNRIYGFGPVEQIILTVNMALRRQQSQLSFFTEGNIPEALAQVPDTWTPADLKQFQSMFDVLGGDLGKRSRFRFLPKLDGPITFYREKVLMNEFDEWLARIVCFCFSVSPQPFTKMMNRATATSAQEVAISEGLLPIQDYVSGVLNMIVERYMGFDDIEHAFLEEEEQDRLKQAQIDKIYASYGKESIDEQRTRDGQDALGIAPMVFTATGPVPLTPFLKGGPMADGLPQHAKSPEELDQQKAENQAHQEQLASANNTGGGPPNASPPGPANKVRKRSFY